MKRFTALLVAALLSTVTATAFAERNENAALWTPAREFKHFDIKVPTPNLVKYAPVLKLNGVSQLALFCTEGLKQPLYRHVDNAKWESNPNAESIRNQSELAAQYWVGYVVGSTMTYLPTGVMCARVEQDPVAVVVDVDGKFELGASIYTSDHRNIERQRHMRTMDQAIPLAVTSLGAPL